MNLREVQDAVNVGIRVPDVYLQRDVGRIVGLLDIAQLLVFVAVAVQAGHDVAQDRRSRRKASGPLAEHELPVVALAADHHAVVLVVNAVDILGGRHELRHDEHREVFVAHLHDLRHQLDFDVFLAGVLDVRIVNRRDAVREDALRRDIGAQRVYRDDYQLEQRIVASDVERRVAFGESQRLRLRECVGVRILVVENAREDVVRRTVQDTLHFEQQVVVVILFEVADDRNRTARRSVVKQRHVVLFLDFDHFGQVVRQHRLVARNDGNPFQQGAFHDVVRRFGVVDHLDDQVDFGIVEDLRRGVREVRTVDRTGFVERADADFDDFGIGVLRFADHFVNTLSDDAESEQADFNFTHMLHVC